MSAVSLVPGLLVTGRSGTGKTSILRTVAKASQEDPRTLSCQFLSYLVHFLSDTY